MSRKSTLSAALAVALLAVGGSACAESSSSSSQMNVAPIVFQHLPGADNALENGNAPLAGSHWYFIPAGGFVRRDSTNSLTNVGDGCIQSDISATLNADVQLPAGANILGVRIFYYAPNAGDYLRGWFTSYDGAGGYADLINAATTQTGGYFSEYFTPATAFSIDPTTYAYVLNTRFLGSTDVRMCGMRVFWED